MEEHDDWKLGDEGEAIACPRCGKRNRAGLTYCAICGNALGGDLEADPGSLRTLGEAMGGKPRAQRMAPRHSLRGWSIAAALLLLVVVVLTWLQTREQPFRLEDLTAPAPATRTPIASRATAMATEVVVATRRPPAPSPVAVVAPPMPTAVAATALPVPRPTATARPRTVKVRPMAVRPVIAPTVPPPVAMPNRVPATEPADVPMPGERPRIEATEKPSLGTDLQDATRAYRQAVEVHNARVDEYNALADEIQRRNAWDDSEFSVELRRRFDRAREAVENARVQAESLRTRMESVRARYR